MAKPISIALVISGLGPGGAERVATTLANYWVGLGWRVTLLALDHEDMPPYFFLAPDIAVLRLGLLADSPNFVAALSNTVRRVRILRAELQRAAPDIVLSLGDKTNVLTIFTSMGLGFPVAISDRADPEHHEMGRIWSWLRRRLYPRAAAMIAQTGQALEALRAARPSRCAVLPNPIETGVRTIRAGSSRVMGVGRLAPQKGFDRLIEAFAQIASRHPTWSMVIRGEGAERPTLQRYIASHGIEGRVNLPGRTAEPGGWIGDAEIFVLPSRYEGFPNALGEALAAGLPAVAFDCRSGPREMIQDGHNGLLVPEGDVAALAAALDRLMSDPDLRARLGAAARVSMRRFSPEEILPRWTELILSLVEDRP